MTKKYNISSKSDMRRFERDLSNKVQSMTYNTLQNRTYDVTCPHCHASIQVHPGKSMCPFCRKEIDLKLNINFN